MTIKQVPVWAKYLARDNNGDLCIFQYRPVKCPTEDGYKWRGLLKSAFVGYSDKYIPLRRFK